MKSTIFFASLTLCVLSACAKPNPPSPDQQFFDRVEQEVRDATNDPDAVKFRDVKSNARTKCATGSILAKNAFGAYTGYHDFVWNNGEISFEGEGDPAAYLKTDMICTLRLGSKAFTGAP